MKGVGDREEGKKRVGLGEPLLHFSPSPSPPIFAPAMQARSADENKESKNKIQGGVVESALLNPPTFFLACFIFIRTPLSEHLGKADETEKKKQWNLKQWYNLN